MAKLLLAIVLVLAASRAVPDLARLRDFSWLRIWLARWRGHGATAARPALLLPVLVFLLCVLIQSALDHVLFGLPLFAFAVIVLFFCWGPRELDADIDAVLKAPDRDQRLAAAQALRPDPADLPLPLEANALVEAAFRSALSRWFGVLFWFVLLGPAGALGDGPRAVEDLAFADATGALVRFSVDEDGTAEGRWTITVVRFAPT